MNDHRTRPEDFLSPVACLPAPKVNGTAEPRGSAAGIGGLRAAELLRLARLRLADVAGQEEGQRTGKPGPAVVSVTVCVRQGLRVSTCGAGASFDDAVCRAAVRAAADPRLGSALAAGGLPGARLELWVQTASEVVDRCDVGRVDLGLHGVEMSSGGRSACYEPSVPLTGGVSRPDLLLDRLAKEARLAPGVWREPGTTLRRSEWAHYCEIPAMPGRVLRLRRLRPPDLEPLTQAAVRARARLAADRLLAVQSDSGYYLYKFHPFTRRERPGPGNLVRQAGCAYAMARAADAADSPQRRVLLASSDYDQHTLTCLLAALETAGLLDL